MTSGLRTPAARGRRAPPIVYDVCEAPPAEAGGSAICCRLLQARGEVIRLLRRRLGRENSYSFASGAPGLSLPDGVRAERRQASIESLSMSTKTLTVPVAGTSCNGEVNPAMQLTVIYPQPGIIGWKKRTLYILLILLVSVVLINMTLIFWIIKMLDLTSEGPGKIRISEKGIQLHSDVEFLETLSGKQIWAQPTQSLKIESSGNVTMRALNSRGYTTNLLDLGESGLQAVGNYFLIRGTTGNVLLQVDQHEMVVSANHMVVSDSGGLRLDGSLETPLVRGSTTKDLKLESVLKKVKVRSEGTMHVDSPAGKITVTGLKGMNLRSTGGRVVVDSYKLEMKNLRMSQHGSKDKSSRESYQVCMCDNGRLFLAHRDGYCQTQDSVCKDFAQDQYKMRETRS